MFSDGNNLICDNSNTFNTIISETNSYWKVNLITNRISKPEIVRSVVNNVSYEIYKGFYPKLHIFTMNSLIFSFKVYDIYLINNKLFIVFHIELNDTTKSILEKHENIFDWSMTPQISKEWIYATGLI